MKCQDKKLIEKSAQYFEAKQDLQQIYVTSDGQYFYTENATTYHAQQNSVEVFIITREMAINTQKTLLDESPIINPPIKENIIEKPQKLNSRIRNPKKKTKKR